MCYALLFLLGFAAMAVYTSNFVAALECVPGSWVTCVGLGLFPLAWVTARIYSVLLATHLCTWQERLLLNLMVLFSAITLKVKHNFNQVVDIEFFFAIVNTNLGLISQKLHFYISTFLHLWQSCLLQSHFPLHHPGANCTKLT